MGFPSTCNVTVSVSANPDQWPGLSRSLSATRLLADAASIPFHWLSDANMWLLVTAAAEPKQKR